MIPPSSVWRLAILYCTRYYCTSSPQTLELVYLGKSRYSEPSAKYWQVMDSNLKLLVFVTHIAKKLKKYCNSTHFQFHPNYGLHKHLPHKVHSKYLIYILYFRRLLCCIVRGKGLKGGSNPHIYVTWPFKVYFTTLFNWKNGRKRWVIVGIGQIRATKFLDRRLHAPWLIEVAVNKIGWRCQPPTEQPSHRSNPLLHHRVTTHPDASLKDATPMTHTFPPCQQCLSYHVYYPPSVNPS